MLGEDGDIAEYVKCLPNRLEGAVGDYGRQWYVDVPAVDPVLRLILISPNLEFPEGRWDYDKGSSRYEWTKSAIQDGQSAGIPWTVVGMHFPCLTIGVYECAAGTDITNLMLEEKVDLVLSGHEHAYFRTKQLGLTEQCPQLTIGAFNSGCVVTDSSSLTAGAGTVFTTVGTGGAGLRDLDTQTAEAPYFVAKSGANIDPTWGLLDLTVSVSELQAKFRSVNGSFSDEFTILR